MTDHTADLRQQPSVCPECKGTQVIDERVCCGRPDVSAEGEASCCGSPDGRYQPCHCTVQQPAQPEARDWLIRKSGYFYRPDRAGYTSSAHEAGRYTEAEAKAEATVEAYITAHHISEYGAQPESGEAVRPVRGRIFAGCDTYIGDATDLWYSAEAYRRLQSALTEAQKDRNAQYDRAQAVSQHNSRLWSEREALRDQLTSAQQRIAALHAALRTYGWHKPECDYMQEELPCTCGFMDAVKEQGNG